MRVGAPVRGLSANVPRAAPRRRLSPSLPSLFLLSRSPPLSLSFLPQAKRRRQFENSQDKAKRKLKEVRMRRSK